MEMLKGRAKPIFGKEMNTVGERSCLKHGTELELCLSRAKPGETLVEARRITDVQIVFLTWV